VLACVVEVIPEYGVFAIAECVVGFVCDGLAVGVPVTVGVVSGWEVG
jgi:hypothetical protein